MDKILFDVTSVLYHDRPSAVGEPIAVSAVSTVSTQSDLLVGNVSNCTIWLDFILMFSISEEKDWIKLA